MVWTSLFGIVTLVLLARALGFAKAPVLADGDAARVIASDALAGFCPREVAMTPDRRAALVADGDGRVALVRPIGDRWVVRVANGASASVDGGLLRLEFAEPMFPVAKLNLGSAARSWAQRL